MFIVRKQGCIVSDQQVADIWFHLKGKYLLLIIPAQLFKYTAFHFLINTLKILSCYSGKLGLQLFHVLFTNCYMTIDEQRVYSLKISPSTNSCEDFTWALYLRGSTIERTHWGGSKVINVLNIVGLMRGVGSSPKGWKSSCASNSFS